MEQGLVTRVRGPCENDERLLYRIRDRIRIPFLTSRRDTGGTPQQNEFFLYRTIRKACFTLTRNWDIFNGVSDLRQQEGMWPRQRNN
jgi:hypothetical protein